MSFARHTVNPVVVYYCVLLCFSLFCAFMCIGVACMICLLCCLIFVLCTFVILLPYGIINVNIVLSQQRAYTLQPCTYGQ